MTAILETRGLQKRFGGVRAIDKVDFTLNEGEVRCLIGPNGAGKSTFFKMLCGQLKPTAGRILFRSNDITGAEPHDIARAGISIKTQVPSLYDGLSVMENIRLPAWRTHKRHEADQIVESLLSRLGLTEHAHSAVGHLSHGQRQWVELGTVLAQDPACVLLDEPTAGMTLDEVRQTASLIRSISGTRAIIVVEHDMHFIRMIAETVTVLHQGRILAENHVESIMRDPHVRDVYLGARDTSSE